MRFGPFFAVALLGSVWSGCSTDASGLGPEFDPADAQSDDTSSTEGDTSVDEDTAVDSSIVDSTSVDTSSSETTDPVDAFDAFEVSVETSTEASVEASTEASADALDEAATDTGATVDALVETAADTATVADVAPEVVTDTGPLAASPGVITCSSGGCSKKFCCGNYNLFALRYDFSCSDSCGVLSGAVPLDYACDDKADCGTGQVCCVVFAALTTNWSGSTCRASCGTAPQLCATHDECGAGKTCTVQKVPDASFSYGVCK